MSTLQTLSRGIQVLELISRSTSGLQIAEIAKSLGVHRAIIYRLVATLEEHLLVTRDAEGRVFIGGGIVALSNRYQPQLRAEALPILRLLAEDSGGTAFLCIAQGDECVAIEVAEPEKPLLKVSYRVGSRHPVTTGAAGLAIAMQRPALSTDSQDLQTARRDGFALTHGQLQDGAIGIAAPLTHASRSIPGAEACIGVVAMHTLDTGQATAAVLHHRDRLLAAVSTAPRIQRSALKTL
ncbi:MAG: IclR family transcriptional regulator [Hoeflea sp.]|uniref:IclR family transcriptional regulator n=1 Tax=Hoeflea sp. TaxID=1940281 RepID=UPI003EF5EF6C